MSDLVFESCHSTWHFDEDNHRFRRFLKGGGIGQGEVATEWRRYHSLEVDPTSESFVVVLNAEGTRLLRSWRHTEDCTQCGGHITTVLSRATLDTAIAG
jgi:hypothetical protein